MLEVKDLTFSYQSGEQLLDGISFCANPGDMIWLQGANGSGKTTLLKILAQLLEARGDFKLHDRVLTRQEWLEQVSYIPAEPYLFDYLTGEENLHFIQSLFSVPADKARQACDKLLVQFRLMHAMKQHAQEYSLGMRHKLYWTAMFSRDCSIYILDEPFSAFDLDSQKEAEQCLRMKAEQGSIIIFVSHLHELSERLANRIFRLEAGKIAEVTDNIN